MKENAKFVLLTVKNGGKMRGKKGYFSSALYTHNIRYYSSVPDPVNQIFKKNSEKLKI
jgi:hypothetical protein